MTKPTIKNQLSISHPPITSCQKSRNSRQVPFYEALITVVLLVTALWMQAFPNWQFPSNLKSQSLTASPINNPWQPR
ncbi:hypothetical protein [Aphanothece sacrum]|nr:hypothetical protein [Aphanothece sacrum]